MLFVLCLFGVEKRRIYNDAQKGVYNIVDYGAKANDPSFDNSIVINDLIDKIGPNGGLIEIPIGDFYIKDSIVVNKSYVTFIGLNNGQRSVIDKGNDRSQEGGGGSRLVILNEKPAIMIYDEENQDRITGLEFKNFQIKGKNNDGYGILATQDTDRLLVDNVVITNVGNGLDLKGADSSIITNSWISETKNSITLRGASQQALIANNSLGAQPGGITIMMENPKWFNISGNTIYPDGNTSIKLYNAEEGAIVSNTISSYYVGVIELENNSLSQKNNVLIGNNLISIPCYKPHPEGKSLEWGIVNIQGEDVLIEGNHILSPQNLKIKKIVY